MDLLTSFSRPIIGYPTLGGFLPADASDAARRSSEEHLERGPGLLSRDDSPGRDFLGRVSLV